MKKIIQNSFYQLLVIYTALIVLISLGLFWKFTLQMSLFALIVGILGFFAVRREESTNHRTNTDFLFNKRFHYWLFALAILFILVLRIIPYLVNSIPLGYDTGLYKYGIEHGLENLDNWVLSGGMEPGFLYLMKPISWIFSTQTILTWLLIFFCLLLGLSVWLFTKEYFGEEIALISLLIYAVSVIQFKTFWYMYYKNIIGLSFALCAFVFLRWAHDKKWYRDLFIVTAGFLGAIHRPTFYIFGLTYFFYALISPYQNKKYNFKYLKYHIINGLIILLIFILFYLGKFKPALGVLSGVAQGFVQTGESPGTFINFFTYQYSTLAYLPFALLGFFFLARKKEFNPLFLWALITGIIVYFQFFFFNRFIIHLDIALIILSSIGFSTLIKHKRKLGIIILIIMLLSAGFVALKDSINSKPLINEQELSTIKQLQNTEPNAFVMATSSTYSPWLQGYSNHRVIAPGLFDYDQHNLSEWNNFWATENIEEIKTFMNAYEKPLYVFIGQQQRDTLEKFNESGCFSITHENSGNKIYKYIC